MQSMVTNSVYIFRDVYYSAHRIKLCGVAARLGACQSWACRRSHPARGPQAVEGYLQSVNGEHEQIRSRVPVQKHRQRLDRYECIQHQSQSGGVSIAISPRLSSFLEKHGLDVIPPQIAPLQDTQAARPQLRDLGHSCAEGVRLIDILTERFATVIISTSFIPGRRSGAEVRSGISETRTPLRLLHLRISCPEERNVQPERLGDGLSSFFGHPSRDCRLGRGITLDFFATIMPEEVLTFLFVAGVPGFCLLSFAAWKRYVWVAEKASRRNSGHLPVQLDRCLRWSAVSESIPPKRICWLTEVSAAGQEVPHLTALQIAHTGKSLTYAELETRARNKWLLLFPAFSPVPIRSSPWRCPRTIGTSLPAISVF